MSGNNQPSKLARIGVSHYSRNSILNTRVRVDPWVFIHDKRMDINKWEVLFHKIQAHIESIMPLAHCHIDIYNKTPLAADMKLKIEVGSTYGLRVVGVWNKAIITANATGKITHTKFAMKIQAVIINALQAHVKANPQRPTAGEEDVEGVVINILQRIFSDSELKGLANTRAAEIFKSVIDIRRITNKLNQLRTKKRLDTAFLRPTHVMNDADNSMSYLLALNGAVGYVCSIENIVEAIIDYEVAIIEEVTKEVLRVTDRISDHVEIKLQFEDGAPSINELST